MSFIDIISVAINSQGYSYLAIFILMVIEGPLTTMFASFAASLGHLNIFIIFILSFLGDVIGDLIHYTIGKYLRKSVLEKYWNKKGINKSRIQKLEKKLNKNFLGAMIIGKPTAPLSTITLLLSGALKIPLKKFILVSAITTLPLTILYVSLGFFFGSTLNNIIIYLKIGKYAILFVIIIFIILFLIYKKISSMILKSSKI